jgi:hypothetical protein
MAGQSSQLTRKESASLQKKAEASMSHSTNHSPMGSGADPEHCSQKGTKANPKGSKG